MTRTSVGRPAARPPVSAEGPSGVRAQRSADDVREAQFALGALTVEDVDLFLAHRAGKAPAHVGLFESLKRLVTSAPKPSKAAGVLHESIRAGTRDLATLAQLTENGPLDAAHVAALGSARARLERVLALAEPSIRNMLPRDVREKLERDLFEPLEVLVDAAHGARPDAPAAPVPAPVVSGAVDGAARAVFVGGAETVRPEVVRGTSASGALFTDRGIGYKDYNEDGAVLGVMKAHDGKELVYAGAFDQAGGMGKVPGQTGAASRIAATRFEEAVRAIAAGELPALALKGAAMLAHFDVCALSDAHGLEVGAMTTIAAGVIHNGVAVVIACGDSAVLLVDKHGHVKKQTEPHNLGDEIARDTGDPNRGLGSANLVTSALGQGGGTPRLDVSVWPVEPGDRLVFLSDGVLDANLPAQKRAFEAGTPWTETAGDKTIREVGRLVAASEDPVASTQAVVDYARTQVVNGDGKKDNLTAVVVRAS